MAQKDPDLEKVPSVRDLKKVFENFEEALDNTHMADLGAKHYPVAKKRTLTLSLKKRERKYSDLRSMFEQPGSLPPRGPPVAKKQPVGTEEKDLLQKLLNDLDVAEEKPKQEEEKPKEEFQQISLEEKKDKIPESMDSSSIPTDMKSEPVAPNDENQEKPSEYLSSTESPFNKAPFTFLPPGYEEPKKEEVQEEEPEAIFIRTDKDLVSILMDIIHETFYNPDTGLWPKYDFEFDREAFTSFGKVGWDAPEDTDERLAARELINRQKNIELDSLMNSEFVQTATEQIHDTISAIVSGVKRSDVRRGIKNHIRVHLYYLIYGQETVLNNSRFKV